jgi:hypothetical protein
MRNPDRHPKHEYYLFFIVRAFKKALRITEPFSNIHPHHVFKKRWLSNSEAIRKWMSFEDYILQHPELYSVPTIQPRTASSVPSFFGDNRRYLQCHFSSEAVRVAHYLFTDVMFEGDCEELCGKMGLRCHQSGTHTEECEQKWRELKEYAQNGMVTEVEWEQYREVDLN